MNPKILLLIAAGLASYACMLRGKEIEEKDKKVLLPVEPPLPVETPPAAEPAPVKEA